MKTSPSYRTCAPAVLALALCTQASGALAQTTPTGDADPSPPDIIVTAQHRAESISRAPLAISAVSGAEMARQGSPMPPPCRIRCPACMSIRADRAPTSPFAASSPSPPIRRAIPLSRSAAEMPVANAWLDLSKKPYAYHLAASPAVRLKPDGTPMWKPYAIVFDEDSHRMTIRRQSDGGLELSGPYTVSEEALSGPDIDWVINGSGPPMGNQAGAKAPAMAPPAAPPPATTAHAPKPEPVPPLVPAKGGHLVALKVTIVVDQVAPEDEGMYKVGAVDTARIVYDTAQINPVTHTVPLLEEAHLIAGHYHTNRITGASQLSLGSEPYHLTYASAVNHGRDLVVLFEGASNRMAMLARPDFHMLIAGHYVIDPKPVPYDPAHPEN